MLPAEKSERWAWRILYAALILIALYVLLWLVQFVYRVSRRVLQQRQLPAEACLQLTDRG